MFCDYCSSNDAGICHDKRSNSFGKDVSGQEICKYYEGEKMCFENKEVIPDENILMIWVDDEGNEVALEPSWYQDNGTPIDDEGNDYRYSHTIFVER